MVVSSVPGLFQNRRAVSIRILLVTCQSLKAVGLWIELAEEAVERSVLQHQHDEVVDLLQLTHISPCGHHASANGE
jgi:hypothetical protein